MRDQTARYEKDYGFLEIPRYTRPRFKLSTSHFIWGILCSLSTILIIHYFGGVIWSVTKSLVR